MKLTNITREEYTTYVGLLTVEQKDSLLVQWYAPDCYFNPVETAIENQWVISVEEMANCTNEEFLWVKDLPLIIYEPKPSPPPFN
jgi:hypothetical protein